jgi:hypothetical protein
MAIERELLSDATAEHKQKILARIDEIRDAVNDLRTPLAFADQLFVLREHINGVRNRLVEVHTTGDADDKTSGP